MSIILTIIVVVIIFSALVLIHEYGHFVAARRAGIKVLEFGIGFPPRLFKKKIGETTYSINAIPFGGFVKLYGEDSTDPALLKDRRSFAHQSPWVRTKVVLAGVAMNFVLAIVLLTIGFTFGIEPLLVNQEDLFTHLALGNVKSAPGAYISKVGEQAGQAGLTAGDQILSLDDKSLQGEDQLAVFEKGAAQKDLDVTVRDSSGTVKKIHLPLVSTSSSFGVDLKPYTQFPRLIILDVKRTGSAFKAGLRPGDAIIQVDEEQIYAPADFENALSKAETGVTITVLRGETLLTVPVSLTDQRRVVISEVFGNSAAQAAGLAKTDLIVAIDGQVVVSPEQVQTILRNNPGKEMVYRISRSGQDLEIKAKTGQNNMLGIALSTVSSYRNADISFYRGTVLTSLIEIKKVRYNPWQAFKQSLVESVRLTGVTISAFGKTITSVISKFKVPSEIGGPVQIAYYTHSFIQEGFFALLRFMALLSLSLAVINILPIPALDGGRFLFIVIEVVLGRKINARLESIVHAVGFALLMLLIVLVTYSDLSRLF